MKKKKIINTENATVRPWLNSLRKAVVAYESVVNAAYIMYINNVFNYLVLLTVAGEWPAIKNFCH